MVLSNSLFQLVNTLFFFFFAEGQTAMHMMTLRCNDALLPHLIKLGIKANVYDCHLYRAQDYDRGLEKPDLHHAYVSH